MSTGLRTLIFIVLPILGVLVYPPQTILGGLPVILVAMIGFALLGWMEWQGRKWGLTLSIFLQGFNVIVRVMMFVSHAVKAPNVGGGADVPFIIASIIGILISLWVLLRLDRIDVQKTMIR
jgi:hypothetical protein